MVLERGVDANSGAWARLQECYARGIVGGTLRRSDVRVDVFLAELEALRDIKVVFGESVSLGPALETQLRSLAADRKSRDRVILETVIEDLDSIEAQLLSIGFVRPLKPFQLRNLAAIIRLPHGADFSVPGAGKTTVALANFALGRSRGLVNRLLVVAPMAAFEAWKDDSAISMVPAPIVVVHSGPDSLIADHTDILLTTYNRVASDYDRIREFVAARPTHVVLDEAHRIKKGEDGVHGRAVLDLAYTARRRDVLTGTPAPQGAFDLIALVQFLYPGQDRQIVPRSAYVERDGRDPAVLSDTHRALSRYFVRTAKSELALPPTRFDVVRRPMGSVQGAIYNALVGRYGTSFQLERVDRREFDRLGRIVMYLLEAATNPMLLAAGSDEADEPGFLHPPLELQGDESLLSLLSTYSRYETPWKYETVASLVEEAAGRGEKIVIWSNFVRNLKALARHLGVYNPAVIHGGVPWAQGKTTSAITRDDELRRFRHDKQCSVLLANPGACGEGVSLHHWCHHAVYLDRSFNAGQFLQSQDRIHRLGLQDGVLTRFTLLLSGGTIDDSVDGRLREKVTALSRLMNDPGLVRLALPEPEEGDADPPTHDDDLHAVVAHVREVAARAP